MANTVKDIIDNSRTVMINTLALSGDTWQQLRNFYDIEKNDIRSAAKAFGIKPLSAAPENTVTNFYTVDHTFEIILTDTITRVEGDSERETALTEIYNQLDEIFKQLQNSKINGTANVLLVSQPSISEPEFLDDNKFLVVRAQYVVKYRGNTL